MGVVREVRRDDEDSNGLPAVELGRDVIVGLGDQHCGRVGLTFKLRRSRWW